MGAYSPLLLPLHIFILCHPPPKRLRATVSESSRSHTVTFWKAFDRKAAILSLWGGTPGPFSCHSEAFILKHAVAPAFVLAPHQACAPRRSHPASLSQPAWPRARAHLWAALPSGSCSAACRGHPHWEQHQSMAQASSCQACPARLPPTPGRGCTGRSSVCPPRPVPRCSAQLQGRRWCPEQGPGCSAAWREALPRGCKAGCHPHPRVQASSERWKCISASKERAAAGPGAGDKHIVLGPYGTRPDTSGGERLALVQAPAQQDSWCGPHGAHSSCHSAPPATLQTLLDPW